MSTDIKLTKRGFKISKEFTDTRKNHIYVQRSSSVEPCVWVWVKHEGGPGLESFKGEVSMHLNKKQVKHLIELLQEVIR